MPQKRLPPLAVGQAYVAEDVETFGYLGAKLTGSAPILRLHLKNATTIDLPTTNERLRQLMHVLCDAFPKAAVEHVVEMRGWAQPRPKG